MTGSASTLEAIALNKRADTAVHQLKTEFAKKRVDGYKKRVPNIFSDYSLVKSEILKHNNGLISKALLPL
jgi:hypothetical protein